MYYIYVEINRGHLVWLLPRSWLLFGGVFSRGLTVVIGQNLSIIHTKDLITTDNHKLSCKG